MSFVIDQQPERTRPRRRWPWVLVAVLAVLAVAIGAFVLGRGASSTGPAPAPAGPRPSPEAAPDPWASLQWKDVAGSPVPRSAVHGPEQEVGGVASGYTHDEPGAVLAAINISTRVSSAAGPGTYESVLAQQTYGDADLMRSQLQAESSSTAPGQTRPNQWWYSVRAGDPTGDLVEVSLIARTPQSDQMGGFVRIDSTLSWRDGDWRMQVPQADPSLATSTRGYTQIPGPGQ